MTQLTQAHQVTNHLAANPLAANSQLAGRAAHYLIAS
jgi:hypothetical protein